MRKIVSILSSLLLVYLTGFLLLFSFLHLLGLQPMYVISGSMEPTFYRGDLLLKVDNQLLPPKEGDIIAFKPSWAEGRTVTHRLVSIYGDEMITKGDNNIAIDPEESTANITGVIVSKTPYLGWLAMPWVLRSIGVVTVSLVIADLFITKRKDKENLVSVVTQ